MRIFYTLIALLLTPTIILAQEKAIAKVHYNFLHINDTTKRDQPQKDEVVLYLGHTSSFYKSYSDERTKQSIDAQKLLPDYSGHMVLNLYTTPIKNFYLRYPNENRLVDIQCISSSFDAYYTEGSDLSQLWELKNDTKEIGGYSCQQATTSFNGRNYIAWFTTELPFQAGPWKLNGLPGLILSAYDEAREVVFEYAGFDAIDSQEPFFIEVPFYVTKGTKAEIAKMKDLFQDDEAKYFKALNSSGKLAIANSYYGIDYSKHNFDFHFDEDYKPSFVTNNPIEKVK